MKAARKDFESFPEDSQQQCLAALTIAAAGGKADIAKPMQGLGSGVLEMSLRTPKHEIDLVRQRLKRLKEGL